jgi:hypothetical protein
VHGAQDRQRGQVQDEEQHFERLVEERRVRRCCGLLSYTQKRISPIWYIHSNRGRYGWISFGNFTFESVTAASKKARSSSRTPPSALMWRSMWGYYITLGVRIHL